MEKYTLTHKAEQGRPMWAVVKSLLEKVVFSNEARAR